MPKQFVALLVIAFAPPEVRADKSTVELVQDVQQRNMTCSSFLQLSSERKKVSVQELSDEEAATSPDDSICKKKNDPCGITFAFDDVAKGTGGVLAKLMLGKKPTWKDVEGVLLNTGQKWILKKGTTLMVNFMKDNLLHHVHGFFAPLLTFVGGILGGFLKSMLGLFFGLFRRKDDAMTKWAEAILDKAKEYVDQKLIQHQLERNYEEVTAIADETDWVPELLSSIVNPNISSDSVRISYFLTLQHSLSKMKAAIFGPACVREVKSAAKVVYITSHHNKQLQDKQGHVALHENKQSWEEWIITDAGSQKVFITSNQGKVLRDDQGTVNFGHPGGPWEKWSLSNAPGKGKVYITSHRGKLLATRDNDEIYLGDGKNKEAEWTITRKGHVTKNEDCKKWQEAGTLEIALFYAEFHIQVFVELLTLDPGIKDVVVEHVKTLGEEYSALLRSSYNTYKAFRDGSIAPAYFHGRTAHGGEDKFLMNDDCKLDCGHKTTYNQNSLGYRYRGCDGSCDIVMHSEECRYLRGWERNFDRRGVAPRHFKHVKECVERYRKRIMDKLANDFEHKLKSFDELVSVVHMSDEEKRDYMRSIGMNVVTENAPDVGGWGGSCTCPDGQVYQVGDLHNECGSIACSGGASGTCKKTGGPWAGRKVECAKKVHR